MLSFCLKFKTDTESKKTKVLNTSNERMLLLSKCKDLSKSKEKVEH